MRCDNCGWMNPEGIENCQKCNQKLKASYIEEVNHVDVQEQAPATNPVVVNCEKCGREYSTQMSSCPHCGFSNPKYQECNDVKTQSLDMNKTVAFGIGNHSAPKASPFAVHDKSELKKTMVAGANIADPLASPMVHDKSELKKTMVAGANIADPLASPMVHDKSELKKTMVAADLDFSQIPHDQAQKSEKEKLQQTVCDGISDISSNNDFKYSLQSLDHGTQEPVTMTISTSSDICLKKGDMIFIAGMRYSVI